MSKFAPIVCDIVGITGAGVMLYGVSLVSTAAALILWGGGMVGLALLWALKG